MAKLKNNAAGPTRRIFISMPADYGLDESQKKLKLGVVNEVKKLGYEPQIFVGPAGGTGLAAGRGWDLDGVDRVIRRCVGAVLIGQPKWRFSTGEGDVKLATEYCHYEGAVAYTYRLPILAIVESGIEYRAIFTLGGLELIGLPPSADRSFLRTPSFRGPFENWKKALEERSDLFLGYCSKSGGTADNIKTYLKGELKASVLDWEDGLRPAGTILEQIHDAARRCSGGIFLFTRDDIIDSGGEQAAPRDNVVFEAGYFAQAKGKDRVLIVREQGAKMPADLGGDIYANLTDRANIASIKPVLKRFVEKNL